jgi:LmbE family N-acetylglucosaminyl deacetylase
LIGAAYQCAEFRDMAIFNSDDARRRVTELVRASRPDIVLTAAPVDYHCDHEAASILVRDACFAASVPNYATNAPQPAAPLDAIPHLYFMDSLGAIDRFGSVVEPDFVVDVKTAFDTKRRMLACHASQQEWLKQQHGIEDYLAKMERWTRTRGALVGIDFGEGYRHYAGHPYPETPLLEELLGSKAIIHDRQWGSAR